jgi:hypothetical protein
VFRAAVLVLAALLAVLLALAVAPGRERAVPESAILLQDASVTLYPRADPDAVWRFRAPEVSYRPATRETTLYRIEDGERRVAGETDFTLASEEVVIDGEDNLRGDAMTAHLTAEAWQLDMRGQGERQVLIDQRLGQFEIPHLELTGEGATGTYENMRISFDLQTFEAGGPGTIGVSSFDIGSSDPGSSETGSSDPGASAPNESEDP